MASHTVLTASSHLMPFSQYFTPYFQLLTQFSHHLKPFSLSPTPFSGLLSIIVFLESLGISRCHSAPGNIFQCLPASPSVSLHLSETHAISCCLTASLSIIQHLNASHGTSVYYSVYQHLSDIRTISFSWCLTVSHISVIHLCWSR